MVQRLSKTNQYRLCRLNRVKKIKLGLMTEVMESKGNRQKAALQQASFASIFLFLSDELNVFSSISESLKLNCKKGKNADESCLGNLSSPTPPSSRHCRDSGHLVILHILFRARG